MLLAFVVAITAWLCLVDNVHFVGAFQMRKIYQKNYLRKYLTQMHDASDKNNFQLTTQAALATIATATLASHMAIADDTIAPPAAPPITAMQLKQAPKAAQSNGMQKMTYSTFLDSVEKNHVEKVTFTPDGKKAVGVDDEGDKFIVDIPNDPNLLSFLVQHKVEINVAPLNTNSPGGSAGGKVTVPDSDVEKALQTFIVPGAVTLSTFIWPLIDAFFPSKEKIDKMKEERKSRRQGPGGLFGGGPNPFGGGVGPGGIDPSSFAKSQAKVDLNPVTNTNFADVAGCDAAKNELEEVVDFLKRPDEYTAIGAKIPRGVLLYGPPGTGKTLLARAVAGEAGVPFIVASGSEFVQVFVGVGAARIRDLFRQARENAPCIIFIDEIDAVGRQRGRGMGNDEREQTLNQLLVEMDGFDTNSGVIVIAATNRVDILDNALIRTGRFDRKVEIGLPDFNGRIDILKVHARNKALSPDVDLEQVARRTPGLSGAALMNLLNEAAIHAARYSKDSIDWDDVDWAIDRVTVGLERSNKDATVRDLEIVAFHEAGHAIVGGLMPEYDTVTKISIVPRTNGAGGLTFFSPLEDRLDNTATRHYLECQLAVAWGGRVAEELVFGSSKVTTGASGDLEQIFRIARAMVCELGMSRLPPLWYDFQQRGPNDVDWQLSAWLKERINAEVIRLASNGYYTAKKILQENEELLWELAGRLVEEDQVSQEEFHFMLHQHKAKTHPYGLYGDTKIDEMPYQIDSDSIAEDIFENIPRISSLLPTPEYFADPEVQKNVLALKKRYEEAELDKLERMRNVDPLMDPDWGKSKFEVITEAQKLKVEEERKAKLLAMLEDYEKEEVLKKKLKSAKARKDLAASQLLNAGVL